MATSKIISGNIQKNNGGTVFLGGSNASGVFTNNITNTVNSAAVRKDGKPVLSATLGNAKALSSGTFAYLSQRHMVVLGNGITTQLAGVNTSALKSSYNSGRPSIAKVETIRSTWLTGASWSGSSWSFTLSQRNTSFGNDIAARSTHDAPGKLQFMTGKTVPTTFDYKPTTNG